MKLIVYTVTKCFTTVRQGAAHNCGELAACGRVVLMKSRGLVFVILQHLVGL